MPTAKPAPPSFRPSKGKVIWVSFLLLLLLGGCTALFLLGMVYKRKYGEMIRKEKGRLDGGLHLEYARDNLGRAERLARLPETMPEEVKDLCENAVTGASRAIALRPDLEQPYLIRGRALEMQYRFEEAEADYNQALQNYKYSYAHLHRGYLGLRRHSRLRLIGTPDAKADAAAERAREDLRLHTYYSTGDVQDDRNKFVAQVGVAYFSRDFDKVPVMAETAARFDPTEWLCPLVKGLALAQLEQWDAALAALEEASKIFLYGAEAHAWAGYVHWKKGRTGEAIEALTHAIKRDDQFFEAVYLRALVLSDARRHDEARRDFLFCSRVRPSFTEARSRAALAGLEWWRRTGQKDIDLLRQVLSELDLLLSQAPALLEAKFARARARVEMGDLDGALSDVGEVILRDPKRAEALELRARIHVARKDWESADRDLSASGNVRERARVRTLAGRYDDALADLDLLLLKDPKDASVLLQRARVQIAAGRPDDAIATLAKIADNIPRAKVVHAEALLAKKDFEGAHRLADEAFQSDPQLGEALWVRGKAALELGRKAEAEEDFKRARELDPTLK